MAHRARGRSSSRRAPRQRELSAAALRPSHRHLPCRSSARTPPRGAMICSPGQLEREWTLFAGGSTVARRGANPRRRTPFVPGQPLADDAEVQFVLDSSGEPMSYARVQKLRAPAQSPPAPPFRPHRAGAPFPLTGQQLPCLGQSPFPVHLFGAMMPPPPLPTARCPRASWTTRRASARARTRRLAAWAAGRT